jgi:hypothetical protein
MKKQMLFFLLVGIVSINNCLVAMTNQHDTPSSLSESNATGPIVSEKVLSVMGEAAFFTLYHQRKHGFVSFPQVPEIMTPCRHHIPCADPTGQFERDFRIALGHRLGMLQIAGLRKESIKNWEEVYLNTLAQNKIEIKERLEECEHKKEEEFERKVRRNVQRSWKQAEEDKKQRAAGNK